MTFYRCIADFPSPTDSDGTPAVLFAASLVPGAIQAAFGPPDSWGGMAFTGPSQQRYFLLDHRAASLLGSALQSDASFWQSRAESDFVLLMYKSDAESRAFCDWLLERCNARPPKSAGQLNFGF